MGRKPVLEGGKREQILLSARSLFLEKGFDATSVRAITQKTGCEIGLFYYYFKSKDEVFDRVFDASCADLDAALAEQLAQAARNPSQALPAFYDCLAEQLGLFDQTMTDCLHWSVRDALVERALACVTRRAEELCLLLAQCGLKLPLSPSVTGACLARGLGGSTPEADAPGSETERAFYYLLGTDPEEAQLRFPQRAKCADLEGWLALAERTAGFASPGAKTALEQELRAAMDAGQAFVLRRRGRVVGGVAARTGAGQLVGLAVQPGFPGRELGARLVETGLACFPVGDPVSVTTGDEELIQTCLRLGFTPASGALRGTRGRILERRAPETWSASYRI